MATKVDGDIRQVGDDVELRFERELRHPIEKVWAALTVPERMRDWYADGEIELRVGGRVYLKGDEIESTVTEIDPPRLIQYGWRTADWDGGQIRWELEPIAEGTKLTFTHVFTSMTPDEAEQFRVKNDLPEGWDPLPSTLAGWHTILGNLASALDGDPPGAAADWRENRDNMKGWEQLNEHYKKVLAS